MHICFLGFLIVALTCLSVLILISITTYIKSYGHSQPQADLHAGHRHPRNSENKYNIDREEKTYEFEPLVFKEKRDVYLQDMVTSGEYSDRERQALT